MFSRDLGAHSSVLAAASLGQETRASRSQSQIYRDATARATRRSEPRARTGPTAVGTTHFGAEQWTFLGHPGSGAVDRGGASCVPTEDGYTRGGPRRGVQADHDYGTGQPVAMYVTNASTNGSISRTAFWSRPGVESRVVLSTNVRLALAKAIALFGVAPTSTRLTQRLAAFCLVADLIERDIVERCDPADLRGLFGPPTELVRDLLSRVPGRRLRGLRGVGRHGDGRATGRGGYLARLGRVAVTAPDHSGDRRDDYERHDERTAETDHGRLGREPHREPAKDREPRLEGRHSPGFDRDGQDNADTGQEQRCYATIEMTMRYALLSPIVTRNAVLSLDQPVPADLGVPFGYAESPKGESGS